MSALRFALAHPLTSSLGAAEANCSYEATTTAMIAKQREKMAYKPKPSRHKKLSSTRSSNVRQQQAGPLNDIEQVLDHMNAQLDGSAEEIGDESRADETMASLVKMVNRVMESYDSQT